MRLKGANIVAGISGKHVVVLGSAMGLGEALYQQFDLGNLPVTHLNLDQLPWEKPEQLEKLLLKTKPTVIVNTLPLGLVATALTFKESHSSEIEIGEASSNIIACTQAMFNLCRQHEIKILQISSAQIFAASDKKSYDENDKPLKHNALSEMMYHCEQCLSPDYEQWMLLRLADIIHTEGDNIFTHCLGRLIANRRIEADSSVRFAPIWLDDALRVSATLVRQLLSGAENWGVFHYGSADPCSEREFTQQIVESITALKKDWTAQLVSVPSDKQGKVSTVLKCRRVRNNFGVHGRTWRQGLKARIQFWLDCYGSEYKQLNAAASESVSLPNAG